MNVGLEVGLVDDDGEHVAVVDGVVRLEFEGVAEMINAVGVGEGVEAVAVVADGVVVIDVDGGVYEGLILLTDDVKLAINELDGVNDEDEVVVGDVVELKGVDVVAVVNDYGDYD